jgi:CubicO group peptidase (beta-lactamase class C family)
MDGLTRRTWVRKIAASAGASALPLFLVPSVSVGQEPEVQATRTGAESAAMAEIARQFMDRFQVPGLSVTIARHGQVVYQEGFGLADKTLGERVTPAHLFRIASISKPITAVAIYSLIEQGRLKLDDLVFGPGGLLESDYGKLSRGFENEITLHHLLTHTSGAWEIHGDDPMFHHTAMEQPELIAWTLERQPLKSAPGQHFAYSNFGYCLLGRVLEKLGGRPYAEFVQQNVFAKCDASEMRIAGNTLAERAPREVVYYGQEGGNPYDMNVRRMDSHGGWIATTRDLVRFAMHVDGFTTTPNILGKAALKSMTTPTAANASYASGWNVNKAPNWWHGGSIPGTNGVLVRTASGLCWAALANTRATGIDLAIDETMWKIARAVPAWKA